MIVGCYSLDLYCDTPNCREGMGRGWQFTGPTEARCMRKARDAGWKFSKVRAARKAWCPACAKGAVRNG